MELLLIPTSVFQISLFYVHVRRCKIDVCMKITIHVATYFIHKWMTSCVLTLHTCIPPLLITYIIQSVYFYSGQWLLADILPCLHKSPKKILLRVWKRWKSGKYLESCLHRIHVYAVQCDYWCGLREFVATCVVYFLVSLLGRIWNVVCHWWWSECYQSSRTCE